MAITVNVNGVPIQYPQTGDPNWGENATNFAIQTSAALGKIGLSSGTSVNISGTLRISNGTPSSPSLTPSGDTNTGLYSIGADKLGFAANGSRVGEFGVGYGGFTGNVIQISSINATTRGTTSTNTYVNFLILNSFTPIYSTSDILILFTSGAGSGGAAGVLLYSIFQDNTAIAQSTGASLNSTGGAYTGNTFYYSPLAASAIVAAGSTGARDYSVRIASATAGQIVAIGGRSGDTAIGAYSNLTVMEIQR